MELCDLFQFRWQAENLMVFDTRFQRDTALRPVVDALRTTTVNVKTQPFGNCRCATQVFDELAVGLNLFLE